MTLSLNSNYVREAGTCGEQKAAETTFTGIEKKKTAMHRFARRSFSFFCTAD